MAGRRLAVLAATLRDAEVIIGWLRARRARA
jgi:hypothetical protein